MIYILCINFLNNQWLTILPQFSDFEITAVPIKVEGLSYEDGSISNADRELIEKAVKVIMTTALNQEKNVKMAFELGCTVYSGKPIDKDRFEQALKKLGLI